MKLSDLRGRNNGQRYEVLGLEGDPHVVERLTEMGFEPGLGIEFVGQLPFGGPILVRSNATSLALRIDEAAAIRLQVRP